MHVTLQSGSKMDYLLPGQVQLHVLYLMASFNFRGEPTAVVESGGC